MELKLIWERYRLPFEYDSIQVLLKFGWYHFYERHLEGWDVRGPRKNTHA